MRAPLILRLLRGSPSAVRALACIAAVFALLLSVWAVAGDGALQGGLRLLIFAGIVGVALLPVLGLLWAVISVIAILAPGERPAANTAVPRRRS